MDFTQLELETQRKALKKAIFSGARSVQFGDRRVEYNSLADMQAALDSIEKEISKGGGSPRVRRRLIYTSRGY